MSYKVKRGQFGEPWTRQDTGNVLPPGETRLYDVVAVDGTTLICDTTWGAKRSADCVTGCNGVTDPRATVPAMIALLDEIAGDVRVECHSPRCDAAPFDSRDPCTCWVGKIGPLLDMVDREGTP